jgi:hypothetical protein
LELLNEERQLVVARRGSVEVRRKGTIGSSPSDHSYSSSLGKRKSRVLRRLHVLGRGRLVVGLTSPRPGTSTVGSRRCRSAGALDRPRSGDRHGGRGPGRDRHLHLHQRQPAMKLPRVPIHNAEVTTLGSPRHVGLRVPPSSYRMSERGYERSGRFVLASHARRPDYCGLTAADVDGGTQRLTSPVPLAYDLQLRTRAHRSSRDGWQPRGPGFESPWVHNQCVARLTHGFRG